MGTTTKFTLPYPEPTDPVAAGADAIKALANAIDPTLIAIKTLSAMAPFGGVPPATAKYTIAVTAFNGYANASGLATVLFGGGIFPNGLATAIPIPVSGFAYAQLAGRANVGPTGINFYCFNSNGTVIASNVLIDVSVLAIGW
jgi:hypothetical protein